MCDRRICLIASLSLAGFFAVAGCGDAAKQQQVEEFTGVWSYNSGNCEFTCGQRTFNTDVDGNLNLTTSNSADLLYSSSDGCNYDFNVSGSTANIVSGETCTSEDSDGNETELSPTTWTLDKNGDSMTEEASGNADVETQDGQVNCSFNCSGSLTKQSG